MKSRRRRHPVEMLGGPLGELAFRPWFDRLALPVLLRWYFPLSRGWAAALAASEDTVDFATRLGGGRWPRRMQTTAIRDIDAAAEPYEEALARWEVLFFGGAEADSASLAAAETARRGAAERLMLARRHCLPLHLWKPLAPLRCEIAPPAEVEARHGRRLAEPAVAWPAPTLPEVRQSREYADGGLRRGWLRFRSPVLDDEVTVRTLAPAAGNLRANLVFLHGIGMEPEFWRPRPDAVNALAHEGVRILRPEGPWHGRRRLPGWYGGEPILGRGPIGLIELFQAWTAEIGALLRVLRQRFPEPVALAGISLGALTAQAVAAVAAQWPRTAQPDALLLIATSGALEEVTETGSLVVGFGLPALFEEHGWPNDERRRWLPLVAPEGPPAMAPERVVMLLGEADDLTPYAGGLELAKRWGVPEDNLFRRPQGHFSVSLGLQRDIEPLHRLLAVLPRVD